MTGRWLVACLAAAAVLPAAGCGATDEVSEVVDPVAEAADTTQKAGGAKLSGTMLLKTEGEEIPMAIDGSVDFTERRSRWVMDYAPGSGMSRKEAREAGFPTEDVSEEAVMYSTAPDLVEKLPDDKRWLKIDLMELGDDVGIDMSKAAIDESNPIKFLDYLRRSGGAKKVGTDMLDGDRTTRYRAVIDIRKALDEAIEDPDDEDAQRLADKVANVFGKPRIPIEVWIDEQSLIRRERLSLTMQEGGAEFTALLDVRFSDFGRHNTIELPPEDEVFDGTGDVAESLEQMAGG